jgi:thymidylate synthase
MQNVTARNVHQALPEVMRLVQTRGERKESRNGPVMKVPGPVSICYLRPTERVMFWPERDANPFFHCLEALWMLAGRNDVDFVADILPRMATYSDDDETLNGAYGYRWREHFGYDQLYLIAEALKVDPNDRRQVLSMWDPGDRGDLASDSKDLPCNTQAYFSRTDTGALDMMVTNRSNDAVWGALGANAVHFSFLQEYLATMIGCHVGRYWQVTNNLHLYLNYHWDLMKTMASRAWPSSHYKDSCPYQYGSLNITPLIPGGDVTKFDQVVGMFLDEGDDAIGLTDWFVKRTALPMWRALRVYKNESTSKEARIRTAQNIIMNNMEPQSDWRRAAYDWLERRIPV